MIKGLNFMEKQKHIELINFKASKKKQIIMKLNKTFFALCLFMGGLITSCEKNSPTEENGVTNQIINKTISKNQTFQYDLGNFGDEEGASITKQANHFSTSELVRNINTVKIIYNYTPTLDFVGTDEIQIRSARGSNGASPNNLIVNTTIKLTITN